MWKFSVLFGAVLISRFSSVHFSSAEKRQNSPLLGTLISKQAVKIEHLGNTSAITLFGFRPDIVTKCSYLSMPTILNCIGFLSVNT